MSEREREREGGGDAMEFITLAVLIICVVLSFILTDFGCGCMYTCICKYIKSHSNLCLYRCVHIRLLHVVLLVVIVLIC